MTRIIDGYDIRKQQRGLFKIVEYAHKKGGAVRKRTIFKNLTKTEAENKVYQLERK